MSPDIRIEVIYFAATGSHGGVYVNRWFGTDIEGGEFEALYVGVVRIEGERLAAIELFELDDLDAALARFAELRPV